MLFPGFSRFGGGGVTSGSGLGPTSSQVPVPVALVNRTTAVSVTDGTKVTWNNEAYDNESVIAVSATDMTIPSSGLYRIYNGYFTNTGSVGTRQWKNGAPFHGGMSLIPEGSTPRWGSGISAPVSLASSDAISVAAIGGTTNHGTGGAEYTAFGIERLDPLTQRAHVRKSADQTSFLSGILTWDTEVSDTDNFHDPSLSTRLTVPSGGYTRVRLVANFATASFVGTCLAEITKSGAGDVRGLPCKQRNTGVNVVNLCSAPINVSAGDYFEVTATLGATSSIKAEESTWFSIEEVPSSLKSALVYPSSGQTITTVDGMLSWDSEDHDPHGMHSTSSNTSRLTVPSGCTYARVMFQLKGQLNSTARVQAQVKKNAGASVGTAIDNMTGTTGAYQRLNGCSAWMAVTPGDYFELQCLCSTGTVTTTPGGCWFSMECI